MTNIAEDSGRRSTFIDSLKKLVFIIGSVLCVFAAARNSITWHLERFWGSSGDFWQNLWDATYIFFGKNDPNIGIFGTYVMTNSFYWTTSLLFLFVDWTGHPKFFLKYKIQPDKIGIVDKRKLIKAFVIVAFNSFVVSLPVIYVMYAGLKWRGSVFSGELPTFQWVLFEIFIFVLVEEVGFYYAHRLFHHPRLYKHIHKLHHEWTTPIGLISVYAHPLEHIIANTLPIITGPVIMGSHLGTAWLWFCIALASTVNSHSGYHLPFLPSPEAHDYHHLKFNENFGVLGVLDRLHGTDKRFRQTEAYKRHMTFLSFVPPPSLGVGSLTNEKAESCRACK